MLRSIPPATSTGAAKRLRSADPLRLRTGVGRTGMDAVDDAPYVVKPVPKGPRPTAVTIGPRPPLRCSKCGGTQLVGARCNDTELEVECLSCGGWHPVKEKVKGEDETRD